MTASWFADSNLLGSGEVLTGVIQLAGQMLTASAPLAHEGRHLWGGWGEAALPLKDGVMGVDGGQSPLPPLPLGEGVMGDLCMTCAYGMDLAALVGCLLSQVDMWPGISFA